MGYYAKCSNCKKGDIGYMVVNSLWKKVAKKKERFLCLTCFQKRLGRKLVLRDFLMPKTNPINNGLFGFHAGHYVKTRIEKCTFDQEQWGAILMRYNHFKDLIKEGKL